MIISYRCMYIYILIGTLFGFYACILIVWCTAYTPTIQRRGEALNLCYLGL